MVIKEVSKEKEVHSKVESLVTLVFELAAKGQALDIPFIVGETDIREVHELWGTPEEKSDLSTATYEDYISSKRNNRLSFRYCV